MGGPEVGGGGSIRVDTAEMLRAAAVLTEAREALGRLSGTAANALADAAPGRRQLIHWTQDLIVLAHRQVGWAADGLTAAAHRYGVAEHAAAALLRTAFAVDSARRGAGARMAFGPAGLPLVLLEDTGRLGAVVVMRMAWNALTGEPVEPWLDATTLQALALTLSSLDDGVRGFLLIERPQHLLHEDPGAPFGTEQLAGVLAALFMRPAGTALAVVPSSHRPVQRPSTLAELAERRPSEPDATERVRIERYQDADGVRWIVYSAGTVTFAPDGGEEPFDLASNLLGVGDRPTDSQQAVVQAMAAAGVGHDDPVLFVGHSQGALNVVRLAEDGGYRVAGVVQFGGPTQQIALPESVPVLSVEHAEDPVPVLGGIAAAGPAGLNRVLVRRSLQQAGHGPGLGRVPSHHMDHYRETLRQAEASGAPQVLRFRGQVSDFLRGGDGTVTGYRAQRVLPGPVPERIACEPAGPPVERRTPNERLPEPPGGWDSVTKR